MGMTRDFELLRNITFWCCLTAWVMAQTLKFIFYLLKNRRLDFRVLVSLGGMPSAHSALAGALATSVGLREGFGSPVFALALCFALVVMFDAQSVRRAAGIQAQVLNRILEELFKEHHFSQRRLVELLGHTPLEVLLGMTMGIFISLALHAYW